MKSVSVLVLAGLVVLAVIGEVKARPQDDDWSSWESDEDDQPAPKPVPAPAPAPSPTGGQLAPNNTNSSMHHGHHHHHGNHTAPKTEQKIFQEAPPILSAPMSSVGFNESCGMKSCDSSRGLTCSGGKCTCDNNKIYIQRSMRCESVALGTSSYSCQHDEQCQWGSLGPYSKCDLDSGRCVCLDEVNYVPVIRHKDKCYIQKRVGEFCVDSEVCDASITGKAVCMFSPVNETIIHSNRTKECHCDRDYVFHNISNTLKDECLPQGKSENSLCKADVQCTAGIGPLSRCFAQKCQCMDAVNFKDEVVFFQGRCYKKLKLGDVCETDLDCQAGISDNAICIKHESYHANEKTCRCPEGEMCARDDKDGAGDLVLSLSIVILALVANKVLN